MLTMKDIPALKSWLSSHPDVVCVEEGRGEWQALYLITTKGTSPIFFNKNGVVRFPPTLEWLRAEYFGHLSTLAITI